MRRKFINFALHSVTAPQARQFLRSVALGGTTLATIDYFINNKVYLHYADTPMNEEIVTNCKELARVHSRSRPDVLMC